MPSAPSRAADGSGTALALICTGGIPVKEPVHRVGSVFAVVVATDPPAGDPVVGAVPRGKRKLAPEVAAPLFLTMSQ